MTLFVHVFIIMTVFHQGISYTYDDVDRLEKYLFNVSRYNKNIRPLQNQLDRIQVNISHTLLKVAEFDVSKEKLVSDGVIQAQWYDEWLTWNPSDYGGLELYQLPNGVFWDPKLSMYRSSNEIYIFNERPDAVPSVVTSSGQVTLLLSANFDVTCSTDTTLYPFDSHDCYFYIFANPYPGYQVLLHSVLPSIDIDYYVENNEWHLKETSATVNIYGKPPFSSYRFTTKCTLERRVKFKLIHDFLPTGFLILINLVTFAIPLDSGERLGFSITSYLAFIFLSDSVLEELPRNSLQISVSSYIYMAINIMNSLTVIWSALAVRLSRIDHIVTPVPRYLIWVTMWLKGTNNAIESLPEKQDKETECISSEEVDTNVNMHPDSNNVYKVDLTWNEVSTQLDRLAFRCTSFMFTVLFLFVICYLVGKNAI